MLTFFASRGWPADFKLALCHCVETAKRQILQDVRQCLVPLDVTSFSALHDSVDANWYGWTFDDPFPAISSDWFVAFSNRTQDAIDAWLRSGEMRKEFLQSNSPS